MAHSEVKHAGVYGIVGNKNQRVGFVICPFCNTELKVQVNSLSGVGKKCPCGAKLDYYYAVKNEQV